MRKLVFKTFMLLMALSMTVCAFAYGCIWIFLPYADRNLAKQALDRQAAELVSQLRETAKEDTEALFWNFGRETGAEVLLFDASGYRISPFTFQYAETEEKVSVFSNDFLQGAEYPFKFAGSKEEYVLAVRYNPSSSDQMVDAVVRSVPYVVALSIMLSVLSAWIFSYYVTRPIIRINRIAGKMADLDFSWYCPDVREDEIGMLSKSINKLSDRLHEALDELNLRNTALKDEIRLEKEKERRRMLFFSGISHELKSPLAVVIGQLEGMLAGIGVYQDREKYLARSMEILQSLNQFIKEILFISHIDLAGQSVSKEHAPGQTGQAKQLNLSDLVKQLLADFADYAQFYAVRMTQELEENLFVYGDGALYQKAIGNIIGNAVAHVSENGQAAVSLCRIGDRVKLSVVNTPAHIAKEHFAHLFEAFYRVNESDGNGSGLGLYITRMIFETYQVDYRIENVHNGVQFTAYFQMAEELP